MNSIKILLIAFLLLTQLLANSQECDDWTIYRGNQQLLGYTDASIPKQISLKWTYKTADEIKASPVISNNRIVIGSTDGFVYCLDISGNLIWKYDTGNSIEASALILNEQVYIGNLEGNLFSLSLEDGQVEWVYQTDNQIMASPNWWKNENKYYILVGSYDYYLHCLDASTGKKVWQYELDNFLNSAVAIDDEQAVFGGCDGFLHIVDLKSGKADDKVELATYIASSPVIQEGMAYTGDYDGQFSCIDLQKRQIKWNWKNENADLPFIASASLCEDKIVIGNRDKFVYCFNKNSGELLWKTRTGSRVDASPLIAQNNVLIANMRGDLLILDLNNGHITWTYEIGNPILSNPVLYNNQIFVTAIDGNIYCLGE
jgi:outer membrane protein assembly factor BamB